MPKCQHDGMQELGTVINGEVFTVDPCIYEDIERHENVTVIVSKCINCGHITYRWERQPDTISEYEEE